MASTVNPEELKSIMYWSGLTLHACQQLEYGLKLVLVTMAEAGFGNFDPDDAVAIIEDEKKRTLGQVLGILNRNVRISEGWLNALESALEVRNRFIHGYLIVETKRIINPDTRGIVLAEIKSLRQTVLSGDTAVKQILESLFEFQGLDFNQQMQIWQEEATLLNGSSFESDDST